MRFLARLAEYVSGQWQLRRQRLARREAQKSSGGGSGPASLAHSAPPAAAPPLQPLQALSDPAERRTGDERGHDVA